MATRIRIPEDLNGMSAGEDSTLSALRQSDTGLMRLKIGLRQKIGAILFDLPSYLWHMARVRPPNLNPAWVHVRNRHENIIASRHGLGVKCDWQWTSDLHLAKVFPIFGRWLYKRALQDFPVALAEEPEEGSPPSEAQVSFVIGHRGKDRLPLLLHTLRSIAGQRNCIVECIVVEQDIEQLVRPYLPNWVRYIHTPSPCAAMPYSRAWAFNVGARAAESNCLIFHDGDMLVCRDYARLVLEYHRRGFDFINLKRFIFYQSESHTETLMKSLRIDRDLAPEAIMQNAEAGGSMAADKGTFWKIGGFDERFVGWGGEDNEFWDRAQMQTVYPFGFLPMIHLWHIPQPGKQMGNDSENKALFDKIIETPAFERIRRLRTVSAGQADAPTRNLR